MSHDDMSVDRPVVEALSAIYSSIAGGDLMQASMMAQEVLSDILGQWRRTDNSSGRDRIRLSGSLLLVSTAYAETLLKQQQPKAAYNAVMTALAYTARVDNVDEAAILMALVTAWASVEQVLNASAPADAAQQSAIQTVAEGIASLLYRQYYITGRSNPGCAVLADAYDTLCVLRSLVNINPEVDNPLQLLGLILNASQTAGLLE